MTYRDPSLTPEDVPSALAVVPEDGPTRWRDMVRESADFAFETDGTGRLVAVAPEQVLGWNAWQLLGCFGRSLLLRQGEQARDLFDPFTAQTGRKRHRVWMRTRGGRMVCMMISVAPVPGRPGAVRGIGFDVTEEAREQQESAARLRGFELARLLARRMRRVPLPFASLTVGLEQLVQALTHAPDSVPGGMLILHDIDQPLRIAARAGTPWPGDTAPLNEILLRLCEKPAVWNSEKADQVEHGGQHLLVCSTTNHFIDRSLLVLWRADALWQPHECELAVSALLPMQSILEHEQIQRETARLGRTDVLTGLVNRQGFVEALTRRAERLDRDGLPACLFVLGLDGLTRINRHGGLESGDEALRAAALRVRDLVRPTDLVARLGGDLFALWLDGADQFAAAERAEAITRLGFDTHSGGAHASEGGETQAPPAGQVRSASIGVAVRVPRSFESIDSMLHRAWEAMRAVKQSGGGGWQVSPVEPTP